MTSEQKYAATAEILRALAKARNEDSLADTILSDPWAAHSLSALEPAYGHIGDLLIDAFMGISERTTDKTRIAAVKDIIAHVPYENRPGLRVLHVDTVGHETRYCACDGYRAIRLKQDIPALPHATGDLVYDWPDLGVVFDLTKQEELQLPTIPALKALIAANPNLNPRKAASREPLCLNGKILINAHYLLKMLQALPDARAWMTGRNGPSMASPIYFEHPDLGDGMICPVRVKRDLSTYLTI